MSLDLSRIICAAAAMEPSRARALLSAAVSKSDAAQAAAAFERDLQPVRDAIVEALQAGDLAALRGLRGLLPHLLAEVNEDPDLADVLATQMGKALLDGMKGGQP